MMRISGLFLLFLVNLSWVWPAEAQLMLPGAATPTPTGAAPAAANIGGAKAAGGKASTKKSSNSDPSPEKGGVAITKAPAEDSVVGRQFQRNGSTGVMGLDRSGASHLEMNRLVLVGYQITKPAELCRMDFAGGNISLKSAPRHEGLISYDVEMEACPFSLDVLEGAVQVRGKVCEFKAADCSADPSGIWGPPGASIGEEEGKAIEKLRGKADKDARAGFRALLGSASHDRPLAKEIVREQANFSSAREEMCRDYVREDKHGFCASRVTLARAVYLSAQLRHETGPPANAEASERARGVAKKKPRSKPAPKAAAVAGPATAPIVLAPADR